jgi:hypothetical protein
LQPLLSSSPSHNHLPPPHRSPYRMVTIHNRACEAHSLPSRRNSSLIPLLRGRGCRVRVGSKLRMTFHVMVSMSSIPAGAPPTGDIERLTRILPRSLQLRGSAGICRHVEAPEFRVSCFQDAERGPPVRTKTDTCVAGVSCPMNVCFTIIDRRAHARRIAADSSAVRPSDIRWHRPGHSAPADR